MITNGDIRMIKYFIQKKGDIKMWSEWEEKKDLLAREYPLLTFCIAMKQAADEKLQEVAAELEEE